MTNARRCVSSLHANLSLIVWFAGGRIVLAAVMAYAAMTCLIFGYFYGDKRRRFKFKNDVKIVQTRGYA